MTLVTVRKAEQYGRTVLLPENPEARWLAELAGTKTLTARTLELAERLGLVVVMAAGPTDWRPVLGVRS